MTDKAMEEAQAIIEKHSSHIYNSLDLKAIIASALASKNAEIERLRELFKTLAEGVKVKALDDDQIMEVIKEVAPWKSEPQLNDLLTYEKSPPLFPQATYDVPSYRAERFVRAVERRILATLEPAAPEGGQEAVAGWIVGNGTGLRWRCWKDGLPSWTNDRRQATRYARRIDAEEACREDEDAWIVVEYRAEVRAALTAALKGDRNDG